MNEKDFEDIGKRLHDSEAYPPQQGWAKIARSLSAKPESEIFARVRKHGFKFLLLLLPPVLYFALSDDVTNRESILSIKQETELLNQTDDQKKNHIEGQNSENVEQPGKNVKENHIKHSIGDNNQITQNADETQPSKIIGQKNIHVEKAAVSRAVSKQNIHSVATSKQTLEVSHFSINANTTGDSAGDVKVIDFVTGNSEPPSETITETDKDIISELRITNSTSQDELAHRQTNAIQSNADNLQYEAKTATLNRIDSASTVTAANIAADSDAEPNQVDITRQAKRWRLTLAFLPQYENKVAMPVENDDVLITGLNRSKHPFKIGFGFSVGAGMELRENFYLDAQLIYNKSEQNTFLSYATGKVDTLFAIQQSAESVRIVPVYETANREFSNRYSFLGIRLGATQYFWKNARRRFNVSAMVGAHYMISADVKQNVNGSWITVNTGDLTEVNYSVMIGAGYNLNLSRSWELMINPSITHFLKRITNDGLPYSFKQQSYGMNLMLSKKIGSR